MNRKLKSQLAGSTAHERTQAVDIEAAWDVELARRAEMIRVGKARGEPAEQVFAELRNRNFSGRNI